VTSNGVDGEKTRKNREERAIQIRKDKRSDRALSQRRRCQDEDEELEKKANVCELRQRRMLEALPVKGSLLLSGDPNSQLEGASYFRKVLSVEKNPPVGIVVEAGLVPLLINLIRPGVHPPVQFEAAWALTNIACGEKQHARVLVQEGVIPLLIDLIANSTNEKVREQCLWAVANISADVNECRDILFAEGVIRPLLWTLGIDAPPHRQLCSPSLSLMQHASLAFSNLIKGEVSPCIELMLPIMFALSELIQFNDDKCLAHITNALVSAFDASPNNIQLVLEHGMLGRIRELCDPRPELPFDPNSPNTGSGSTASKTRELDWKLVRENSVKVLCAVARSPIMLHKRLLFSSRFNNALGAMLRELDRSDTESFRKEVCITLREVMETDNKYTVQLVQMNLIPILKKCLETGTFDVMVQAGYCVLYILQNCSHEELAVLYQQCEAVLPPLLGSTDASLQFASLQVVKRLAEWAAAVGVRITSADLHQRIDMLVYSSIQEISSLAAQCDRLISAGGPREGDA